MRLPQSSGRRLPIPVVSVAILFFAFAVFGSLSAQATTQQLICSPTNLGFGGIPVGTSEAQLVVLTNTGQSSATISAISLSGSDFKVSGLNLPAALAAGKSTSLTVTFTPTALGWSSGTVTLTNNSSNPQLQLEVGGSGLQSEAVTAAPASLSFGPIVVGTKATLSVVLTNVRSWKKTLTSFQAMGSAFSVSGPQFPVVLSPGQSVKLSVTFTPKTTGVTSGRVVIYSGVRLNIPVSGTGTSTTIGKLTLSPATVSFGNVELGTSTTETSTLSATGGSVTISSAASSNAEFAIAGFSFPTTINAGQNVPLKVTFTPKKAGNTSANLTLISNATNSTVLETVTGTGTAPFVTLSWSPSTSPVSGYNVYRGTSVGTYSKINSTLDPSTAYTDNTVVPGSTYYYAATAVNSSGQESGYSAPVRVVIP